MKPNAINKIPVIDECIEQKLIERLNATGTPYHDIKKYRSGICDDKVAEITRNLGGFLVTHDDDFLDKQYSDIELIYTKKRKNFSNVERQIYKKLGE